ncbi:MAG: hypothetical protein HZB25_02545 [Candidatus Eisenbacteria bacterium]|nr:hypothetical protein [Candidatus Eisenbacteria bacterium]
MTLKKTALFALCLLALAAGPAARAADHDFPVSPPWRPAATDPNLVGRYGYLTTSNNLLNITFTNYGSWGLGYTSSVTPNFTYPAGSTNEHMVRGGIWIGAKTVCDTCADQSRVAVSFGSQDQNGSIGTPYSEFTPLPNKKGALLQVMSSLETSDIYNPRAVSEQDIIARFGDNPGTQVGDELHFPLNVQVTESIYSWSFGFAENFIIQHVVIKNTGDLLRNVFVTHYTEMQSLNKASYPYYPSLTGAAPYSKKLITYTPSLRLLTERYCESTQGCKYDRVPAVVGVAVLGTHPDTLGTPYAHGDSLRARFLTHKYSGGLGFDDPAYARGSDDQKYTFMQIPTEIEPQEAGTSDPSQWITVGPFPVLQRGDSITVDFAFVGGASGDPQHAQELAELATRNAQLAFNLNYNLPTPPPSPRLYARPGNNALELLWEGSADNTVDLTGPPGTEHDFEGYRVYFGESANNMHLVAQFDRDDTTGFNTGLDSLRLPDGSPVTFERVIRRPTGDSTGVDTMKYHYVIRGLRDGFKYFASVTSFDSGNPRVDPLESGKTQNRMMVVPGPTGAQTTNLGVTVFPNPYRVEARWDANLFAKDHYLWFANLPARCKVRIYTLAGDLVYESDFDSSTYHGANARGVYSEGRDFPIKPPILSGSMFAWDLISRFNQAVGTGLYLYSVEDSKSGKRQVGKFAVIKSDREEQ